MELLEYKVRGFRVLGLHLSLNMQVSFCLLDGELHGIVESLWFNVSFKLASFSQVFWF
jgi:hypothetical protein